MKLFRGIIFLILFLVLSVLSLRAEESELIKVLSLKYDNDSSIVYISTDNNSQTPIQKIKTVQLQTPNRVYFDIENAVLIGEKQNLAFENSFIKGIKLAQFSTNPNVVRTVITYEEDFDTSNVQVMNVFGNIIVKNSPLKLSNTYFNNIYNEVKNPEDYSYINVSSSIVQKASIPAEIQQGTPQSTINEIQKAFENSTLGNSDGKTFDSEITLDLSSKLKLRTNYFVNQYIAKKEGLLVSGIGQLTMSKTFTLNSPDRLVIDLQNTYVDKRIRNREINLCEDEKCTDKARIGQFDVNTARIVITAKDTNKYIPVFSPDMQSLFVVNTDRLNHTDLCDSVSNMVKAYTKKLDSKSSEIIFSFTNPIVHSIYRTDNSLNVFLFNVKSYNEQDINKAISGSQYSKLRISLLPQVGIKLSIPTSKDDIVSIDEGVDAKALKILIKRAKQEQKEEKLFIKKGTHKNKVVLDAGHGGSDYGAIREGINEKDITLEVTQKVEKILRARGYKSALTRDKDDYLSLEERVEYTEKEEPEIFVSIHVNSAVSTTPYGVETHYYHEYSKKLAEVLHKHMVKEIDTKDRGLFKSQFYVINHTTMPAILVEIGFLSNPEERNELINEKRKEQTAKAIADGIIEYFQMEREYEKQQ